MAYTTAARIKYMHPGHAAFVDANGSAISVMIENISAELNTFLKVDSDICTVTDATRESRIVEQGLGDVMSRWINYQEMMGTIAPQNRNDMIPAHLYQDVFVHIQESLYKDRMEENAKAYNYSLRTGTVTRKWY